MPFHSAWESARGQALASACDEADWSAVLDDTRVGWQQAYTRAGHEHNRLANAVTARVSILAEGLEAVDIDPPTCGHCG